MLTINVYKMHGTYCIKTVDTQQAEMFNNYNNVIKGKAIPLQAWTGPEGSRKLRLPDFKTFGT